jgi:demethylmenaquinone methyltransferase/2-methoxy-6-polyprenyl-1,4-benzoquinol methylase
MPLDHFGLIAGFYDRTARFSTHELLFDLLNLPSGGLLLDVGGGTGRVAKALCSMVRETVVADLSRGMLNYAKVKGLSTTCTPAEQLPFASSIFDRIIMVDALHHVFDQRKTITELWRVLAPGGRIVIIEPDIHKFAVKLIAMGEKILLMRSHFLPAEEIAALFENQNTHVRVISDEFNVLVCVEKVR